MRHISSVCLKLHRPDCVLRREKYVDRLQCRVGPTIPPNDGPFRNYSRQLGLRQAKCRMASSRSDRTCDYTAMWIADGLVFSVFDARSETHRASDMPVHVETLLWHPPLLITEDIEQTILDGSRRRRTRGAGKDEEALAVCRQIQRWKIFFRDRLSMHR